ncbi:mucin-1-like [Asparagus officinalis]|uniref:mucin-1-like n=1 Tax=Asparagus officinalis TaxID=4686 RepID=UPI00098E01EE|nr:mucin-1-like [Asparagus officinalis]
MSGSGAALPASSAASGAVPATSKGASPQSGVRPPTGVPTASASASGGVVEKVISVPSDEEEEAGNEEGPTGSADPVQEAAGKEDLPSWTSRSSGETGESEEDDDVSVHEALSSEEEVLAREDVSGQIGGSPAPAAAPAGDRSSVRESPLQREASTLQVTTPLSAAAVDAVTAAPRASLVTPALAAPITTSTVVTTGTSTAISSTAEEAALSPLVRESSLQREASTLQVTTPLSAMAVDAVTAAPRASLVIPALAAPITTSTVVTMGTSTAISSTAEEAALSPLERERRRSAARSVADFQDTLAACIRLALEENCPFKSFEEDIDYVVCFLIKRLGRTAAMPYFQRKEEVKEAVQRLLALRAKSSTLVDLAIGEVRAAGEERDRRLDETMSLEARLSAELEQAKAEDETEG